MKKLFLLLILFFSLSSFGNVFSKKTAIEFYFFTGELTERFPPDHFFYLGVGRSPVAIINFIQRSYSGHESALNFPLTWSHTPEGASETFFDRI